MITEHAKALQGRDFQCVVGDSLSKCMSQYHQDFYKGLADRAASMAKNSRGMRSGKAFIGIEICIYWIYSWDVDEPASKDNMPLLFVTKDNDEYTKWRNKFLEN